MHRDKLIYSVAGILAIAIVALGAWIYAESQMLQSEIADRRREDLELSAAVRHAKATAAEVAADANEARSSLLGLISDVNQAHTASSTQLFEQSAELAGFMTEHVKADTTNAAQFLEATSLLQSQIDKLAGAVFTKDQGRRSSHAL